MDTVLFEERLRCVQPLVVRHENVSAVHLGLVEMKAVSYCAKQSLPFQVTAE